MSDKPKGTPEQRQEYAAIREQADALVERMNAILGDAGRHDYRMELRAVKCALPVTIDDDDRDDDDEADPRYLPDVLDRRPYDEDRDGGELQASRDRRYHRQEEDEYGH